MGVKSMASKQEGPAAGSSDYVRFIVLAEARTGSNMLARALNSNPSITCFNEIFNFAFDAILYAVEGYDGSNAQDQALRKQDFRAFLRERIYCRHPEEIGAVGWKLLYRQCWGYPGLLEHLVEDREICVLHLRRRNVLKRLVSLKLAEATGVWADLPKPRPQLTLAMVLRAARRPLRAATKLPKLMQLAKPRQKAPGLRVSVSKDELFKSIIVAKSTAARFDDLFRDHQILTLFYEELVEHREEVFCQVQEFLGVEPGLLTVNLVKQNPEPLPELLENYDELFEAYRYSKHAWMFD